MKEGWALSAKAQLAVMMLEVKGLDKDLALEVLLVLWGESEVFELGGIDEDIHAISESN